MGHYLEHQCISSPARWGDEGRRYSAVSNVLQGMAWEVAGNYRSIQADSISRRITVSSTIRGYSRRNVFVADDTS